MRARSSRMRLAVSLAIGFALWFAGCDSPSKGHKTVPDPYPTLDSPGALIKTLEMSYGRLDYDKFASLFASQNSVRYQFILSEATNNEASWGASEEIRIHRRMFRPRIVVDHEMPVPDELILQSIDIQLTPKTDYAERTDLYRSASNPAGLDPMLWTATEATYTTYVFFHLAGDTDYQIDGHANFVVIEDKSKPSANDPGKWLIYRWEDLARLYAISSRPPDADGSEPVEVTQRTWSSVKLLYR